MNILYRRLFEVRIQHDYFLMGSVLPETYRVADLFDFVPSKETARLMRNHKIIQRVTSTGFVLMIEAEKSASPPGFITKVNLQDKLKLSFHWFLKEPFLVNFTNQRLVEEGHQIYYFNNRDTSKEGAVLSLNNGIPSFGTTYFNEPAYRLGDLVKHTSKTFELIDKEGSKTTFEPAKWQEVNPAVVNYVNPSSRILWQFPRLEHKRSNTSPGETITYTLHDIDGQPMELGNIPGTSAPQNQHTTSTNASEPVQYALDLSSIPGGRYVLDINEAAGTATRQFYLLDPAGLRDVFAVSEFFVTTSSADFRFAQKIAASQRWLLASPHKVFSVRFKNRLTRWQYLKQDQTIFNEPAQPRPLSKFYTGYQATVAGTPTNMPDPGVTRIDPDIELSTKLVKNIYSKIYLTN